jgi:hypothetical protein
MYSNLSNGISCFIFYLCSVLTQEKFLLLLFIYTYSYLSIEFLLFYLIYQNKLIVWLTFLFVSTCFTFKNQKNITWNKFYLVFILFLTYHNFSFTKN